MGVTRRMTAMVKEICWGWEELLDRETAAACSGEGAASAEMLLQDF